MPTLNRARELARGVMCKSNERVLGIAFSMYAAAWNDQIPPCGTASAGLADTPLVEPAFYQFLGRRGLLGTCEYYKGKTGSVVRNTRYPPSQCPAEGNPIVPYQLAAGSEASGHGLSTSYYDWFRMCGSYVMNISVTGAYYWSAVPGRNAYRPGWSQGSPYYPSSEAMIVTDTDDQGAGWNIPVYDPCIDYYPSHFYDGYAYYYTFRHPDQTGNFLCMDGHVASKKHISDTGQAVYQQLWHELPPSRK